MATKIFPLPINTPLLDQQKNLQLPWSIWLKSVSDTLQDMANTQRKLQTKGESYFVVAGCLCQFTWFAATGLDAATVIDLPYEMQLPAIPVIYPGASQAPLAPSTKTITLPIGTTYAQITYVYLRKE